MTMTMEEREKEGRGDGLQSGEIEVEEDLFSIRGDREEDRLPSLLLLLSCFLLSLNPRTVLGWVLFVTCYNSF